MTKEDIIMRNFSGSQIFSPSALILMAMIRTENGPPKGPMTTSLGREVPHK